MKKALAAGMLAAFVGASSLATAQTNSIANGGNIIGHWTALLNVNGEPQPVFFNIESQKLSVTKNDALTAQFGAPLQCFLKAEYSGYLNGWHNFNVPYHPNFGACSAASDNQSSSSLRFQLLPGGNLRFELRTNGKTETTAVAEPDQSQGR
jgi:hypothetical protein